MRVSSNLTWSGLVRAAISLGGCGLCSVVAASDPATAPEQAGDEEKAFPYAVIVDRNAFRLNPAPPPPGPPPAPAPDLPTVIFSGTRQKGDEKVAMFAVKTKDAQTKQETTTYMSLTVGETQGPVELIKIGPGGDEVEIKNSGTRVVLNMKDNGFGGKTAPAARGPATLPGLRQLPGAPSIPMPGLPGQRGAQAADSGGGGVNVGSGGGNLSGRGGGGIRTAGNGNVAAGAPISSLVTPQPNIVSSGSLFPQSSVVGGNSAAIMTGGKVAASPANPAAPAGLTAIPINPPSTAMPPNYTPPPTRGWTGPMPPVPGE
jgi:hypothetical protein